MNPYKPTFALGFAAVAAVTLSHFSAAEAQRRGSPPAYPLLCKGLIKNSGLARSVTVNVSGRPRIKPHRLSVGFIRHRPGSGALRAGECKWPDRAFRGDELRIRSLYLESRQDIDFEWSPRGESNASIVNNRDAATIDSSIPALFNRAMSDDEYTICVFAQNRPTRGRSTTRQVFRVRKLLRRPGDRC